MKWLHWYFHRKALYYKIIIAVFLTKISPKQDFMVNHAYFFYFVTWISLIFLMLSGVFTDIFWEQKIENLGWYSWNQTKKIETSRAPRWALGPPFVASLLSPALGPSGVPEKFQFIFLSGFMKPPKVSIFAPKNIRETPETIKKINETRSQKKMRGFLLKLCTK